MVQWIRIEHRISYGVLEMMSLHLASLVSKNGVPCLNQWTEHPVVWDAVTANVCVEDSCAYGVQAKSHAARLLSPGHPGESGLAMQDYCKPPTTLIRTALPYSISFTLTLPYSPFSLPFPLAQRTSAETHTTACHYGPHQVLWRSFLPLRFWSLAPNVNI